MIVTNSLTGGGAERSMNHLCNELTYRGWQVALIPINTSGQDQVTPTCEIFPLHREWQGGYFDTFRAILKFNSTVRNWKPNIVILNCDLPELFGIAMCGDAKLVAVEHTSKPWAHRLWLGRIVRKILKMKSTTWVAVSAHLSIWPGEGTPREVISNPVLPKSLVINPPIVDQLNRLVFIGRLSLEKNPGMLLEIAKRIDITVAIIGDGTLRGVIEEEAKSNKLKISLHGQQAQPWSLLTPNDLLIVPSEYEGDGLVVIEALQNGVPLLLSDIPDFRRFGFPNQNYCASVDQYVERIKYFQNNFSELRIAESLSKPLLATRTIENVGNQWEKYLTSLGSRGV